jgi:hypothetical protein
MNGWRRLVPDDSAIKVADLIELIVEEYDINEEVTERLEFSYKTFVGNQGNEKKTFNMVTLIHLHLAPDATVKTIPVTLDDITLQVHYKQGDEIKEDVSCDS